MKVKCKKVSQSKIEQMERRIRELEARKNYLEQENDFLKKSVPWNWLIAGMIQKSASRSLAVLSLEKHGFASQG